MTKLETVILWLHNLGFITRNNKTKEGDPQVNVLINTRLSIKLVNLFNDLTVDLGLEAIPTNAIPAPYKDHLLQSKYLISDLTACRTSFEFWHFKVDSTDIGINVPIGALSKTIKRIEDAPISVSLSFDDGEYDIHSAINDETAFIKVMWVINITMLLLIKLDGPLYLGEALVSTVELAKDLSFVLMQNKRLKKQCGMETWERNVYVQNCKTLCQLSADIIPLVAKLNRFGKILFVDDGLPLFYAIYHDKYAVHATPALRDVVFDPRHIHGIYDVCKFITAKLHMELITYPAIVVGLPDSLSEDVFWQSRVELLSQDSKDLIEKVFTLIKLAIEMTSGAN